MIGQHVRLRSYALKLGNTELQSSYLVLHAKTVGNVDLVI